MNEYPGKLIVIDGTDGSGKATQLDLLKKRLEQEGYEVMVADFPQYNKKSAGLVEEYLSGKYGQADDITPYQASIFYAADRYDASFLIRKWLKDGKIVLANRYVSANMGHQGGKISNPLERKAFFNWLYELEYKLFNIPQPNLSLILHVEAEISQRLAKERARTDWSGSAKDIHENNLEHLKNAEKVYLEIAQTYPEFRLINCTRDNQIMTRDEISLLVWTIARPIIKGGETKDEKTIIKPKETYNYSGFQAIGEILTDGGKTILTDESEKKLEIKPEIKTEPEIGQKTEIKKQNILRVEKINPQAKLPQKAHEGDAGFDLYADNYYSIAPYAHALVSTGVKLAIPKGYVGLVWDKSGIASEGIKTMGGVIDSNYRGEIKVIIKNLSEDMYNIIPGQKIAQILIQGVSNMEISEENINDETERQANGFGSTGKF